MVISNKEDSVFIVYKDGRKKSITKEEFSKGKLVLPPPPPPPPQLRLPPDGLYVLDGKVITYSEAAKIDPDDIQKITVLKGKNAVNKYGEKGKNGVVEIITKERKSSAVVTFDSATVTAAPAIITFNKGATVSANPVYFIDGKESNVTEMENISPANIESINVIKGEAAIKKYGEKGKNGVVEITTKPGSKAQEDTIPNVLFTKVETKAEFPGGPQEWTKYMIGKIQANIDSLSKNDFGTCVVKFIVDKDGSLSHIEATTMQGTRLAQLAIDAIKTGPKWIPAKNNDQVVASYRLQPVTLTAPK